MEGRELGCKTIGCGAAIFIVLLSFYGMLATTERAAKQARAKIHARGSKNAVQNLQVVAIVLGTYSRANNDELPPLQATDDLKATLVPRYMNEADLLINPRDRKPFLPNAALSRRKRSTIQDPSATYLLAESTANDTGKRAVLLLSGTVEEVSPDRWQALQQPPAIRTLAPSPRKAKPAPRPSPTAP